MSYAVFFHMENNKTESQNKLAQPQSTRPIARAETPEAQGNKPEMPRGWDDYESRRDVVVAKRDLNTEDRRRKAHADLPRPTEKLLLDKDDNGSFETEVELDTKLDPKPKAYADSERGYGSGLGGSYPADTYDSDQEETAYYGRPEYEEEPEAEKDDIPLDPVKEKYP